MSDSTKREQLENLFSEVAKAHHAAYIDTDGAHPDWPIWYAEYLRDRLAELLDASFTQSELVYLLVGFDRELQQTAPGAKWQRFYARKFLERYG